MSNMSAAKRQSDYVVGVDPCLRVAQITGTTRAAIGYVAYRQRNALPSNYCSPEKAPNASRQIKMAFTPTLTQNAGGCCFRPETSRSPIVGFLSWPLQLDCRELQSKALRVWW